MKRTKHLHNTVNGIQGGKSNQYLRKDLIVLTNDPSLTAWGWVVIGATQDVLDCDCIKTKPEHKKRRIRAGDDLVRRINDINRQLLAVIKKYGVNYLLAELPHGSQNAHAATMIGVVTGIIQTMSNTLDLPIEWYSEADAKQALLGKVTATKLEIINEITELYDMRFWPEIKYKDEAIADAMAIYHAARSQSHVLKFFQ